MRTGTVLAVLCVVLLLAMGVDGQDEEYEEENETVETEEDEEKEEKVIFFRGTSGVECTEDKRHCVTIANCENKTCVCPTYMKGDGFITCVEKDQMLCEATLSPDIVSYDGCRGILSIPCRHRLTHFIAPCDRDEMFPNPRESSHASFEVFGLNSLSNYGAVYEKGMEIVIRRGFLDHRHHFQQLGNYREVLRVADDDIYEFMRYDYYERELSPFRKSPGQEWVFSEQQWYGYPYFDFYNNFAVLWSRQCNASIKFRTFNYSAEDPVQRFKPGITIAAPSKAKPCRLSGDFPYSLCGWPRDPEDMYKELAKWRHLGKTSAALSYAVLVNHVKQKWNHTSEEGVYEKECAAAETVLDNCYKQERAVACCDGILSMPAAVRCLLEERRENRTQRNIMDTFNTCLSFCCFKKASDCETLADDISPCLDTMPDDLQALQCPGRGKKEGKLHKKHKEPKHGHGKRTKKGGKKAKKSKRGRRRDRSSGQ